MNDQEPQPQGPEQILQMLQQKIGNVELTLHALIRVLDKEDLLEQEDVNDEAAEIVEEMQNQMDTELKTKEINTEEEN